MALVDDVERWATLVLLVVIALIVLCMVVRSRQIVADFLDSCARADVDFNTETRTRMSRRTSMTGDEITDPEDVNAEVSSSGGTVGGSDPVDPAHTPAPPALERQPSIRIGGVIITPAAPRVTARGITQLG
uniref:Uncharacterized protein n=1 Tax=viral metagenome TaxID=1070528 RepID=A0A2V0RAQ7_9ZZZZ